MKLPITLISRKQLEEFVESIKAYDQLRKETENASTFIHKIKEGKLDAQFEGISGAIDNADDSSLAGALLSMRDQMQKIAQAEYERNWATEGLARFVDILRANNEQIEQLYDSILDNLVNYLKANQGALFVAVQDENNETCLEMVACYAYSKKKYVNKRFDLGEGLAGQCYIEKDTIFLTDVPEKYVHITSGLGTANPRCVLIVPLKLNDKMFGVIELASFHVLPPYQIEFVEKLGESIASTISNAQINERTRQLLQISQQQAEEMRSSEEEMRQNLEELSATQEEMRRKDIEMRGVLSALNATLATIEFGMDGNVLNANEAFLTLMGYSLDEVKGKHHRIFLEKAEILSPNYTKFWADLNNGIQQSNDFKRITKYGQEVWMRATYTPVRDSNGRFYKVIKLANDITERKKEELENQRLSLVADNTDNAVIITDKNGLIEYVNSGFEKVTGYKMSEVIGKKPGSFLQGALTDKATIARIREKLNSREPFYEEILNYGKNGNTYWISLSINPIFDEENNLVNFVAIEADITESKRTALGYKGKLDAIDQAYAVVEFDTEGNVITANRLFLNLMGYELSEIQGRHHRMFVPEHEVKTDAYRLFWDRLGRRGDMLIGEYRRVNKKGKDIWLKASYNAILDLDGKPTKIIKYAQDITEAKLMQISIQQQSEEMRAQEEELRQNLEEMQAVQEDLRKRNQESAMLGYELNARVNALNAAAILSEADLFGNILYVNDKLLEVTGYKREELIGKPHSMLRHPSTPKEVFAEMWQTIKAGNIFQGTYQNRKKDGSSYWVEATIAPVLGADGKPEKYVGIRFDITAAKEAEISVTNLLREAQQQSEELRAQEEEIRQNLEEMQATQEQLVRNNIEIQKSSAELDARINALNAAAILSESDLFGNILYVNDKLLEITGYKREELIGKPHSMLRHPSTPKEVFAEMWRTIKAGKVFQGVYQNRKKDGSAYWVEATIAPILDADGKPEKYVGIRFDITAAKEAEIEVNALLRDAQIKAEELRAQEEEIRQNMEEMQAINEEVNRQSTELNGISKALDKSLATIEFDLDSNVLTANENFLKTMSYTLEEIVGKPHRMFVDADYARSNEYVKFWDDLRFGKAQVGEVKRIDNNGEEVWLSASYTPVLNNDGKPYKVIKFAQDVTKQKKEALDTRYKLQAIDRAYGVIEFDVNGNILYANENFLEVVGYSMIEIQGRHHRMFVTEAERNSEEYRLLWEKVGKKGEYVDSEFKRVNKKGEIVWLKATYNGILDMNGKPYKVVKYAQDITEAKKLQMAVQQQTEELRAQEEEIRQNLEEMQATQEQLLRTNIEMEKSGAELDARVNALNAAAILSEADIFGNIIYVNDKLLEITGYTREELIGKPHSILRHPSTPKEVFVEMWRTIKAGQVFQGIYQNSKKDGSAYWVEATIAPVLGADGKPEKYVGIRFDITAAKESEISVKNLLKEAQQQTEELRAQEEEIRQNLEEMQATQEQLLRTNEEVQKSSAELDARVSALNAAAILSEADLFGNITYVNDKLLEITGYTREELIGKPHSVLRHPSTPKEVFVEMWRTIKAGKVFQGIYQNSKKDGSAYWVEATIAPVLGADGKPEKYVGIRFDITAAKESELSIESKQREVEAIAHKYEQILEGCADAVVMINAKGIISFFNASAESLWGYGRADVMGKNVKMLMDTDHSKKHDSYLSNYHKTGDAKVIGSGRKVDALRADGTKVPILLTLSEAKISETESVFTAFIKDLRTS